MWFFAKTIPLNCHVFPSIYQPPKSRLGLLNRDYEILDCGQIPFFGLYRRERYYANSKQLKNRAFRFQTETCRPDFQQLVSAPFVWGD
jgi:hypothetical protein